MKFVANSIPKRFQAVSDGFVVFVGFKGVAPGRGRWGGEDVLE